MARVVLDMRDRRPVWSMPDSAVLAIRDAFPEEWSIAVIESFADGTGDGVSAVRTEVLDAVADAEVYMGYGIPVPVLEAGPELRWVHTGAAGVGGSLTPALLDRGLLFTNSAGIHGPPMAESVLAMILHFSRGLDLAVMARERAEWSSEAYYALPATVGEISRSTVCVLGLGGVGTAVAERMAALGARVIGVRNRRAAESPDAERWRPEPPNSLGSDGWEVVYGEEGLEAALPESDFVVLTVPSTPRTRGLLNEKRIGLCKRGAVVVNVARGDVVDLQAVAHALEDGHLRGAASDVFAREPLEPDDPLWSVPGLLITPHISAVTLGYWDREVDLIVSNVARYRAGRPLLNRVRPDLGY